MKPLNILIVALAMLFAALPASAKLRVLEQGTEATAAQLVLPTRVGGSLSLRACPTCAAKQIATSERTIFQLGDEGMSLENFAQLLRDNPRIFLTVMTDARTGVVTRIRVQGKPVATRAR